MESNVIDFSIRSERHEDRKSADREQYERRRLSEASEIAQMLRKGQKTSVGDREIFARNLGRMWDQLVNDGSARKYSELFETAFGKHADTEQRHRKRLIVSPGETPPTVYVAHGPKFVDLAEAMATMAYRGQPDDAVTQARRRAVLQLIAGSSFDKQRPAAARLKDQSVAAIAAIADQIVDSIEQEVDLNAMRAVIDHDTIAAIIDGDGTVEKLQNWEVPDYGPSRLEEESASDWLNRRSQLHRNMLTPPLLKLLEFAEKSERASGRMKQSERDAYFAYRQLGERTFPNDAPVRIFQGDLDLSEMGWDTSDSVSRFAPRVHIGDILSDAGEHGGVVFLDLDEDAAEADAAQDRAVYDRAIEKHGLIGQVPPFDYEGSLRSKLEIRAARQFARCCGLPEDWSGDDPASFDGLSEWLDEEDREIPDDIWDAEAPMAVSARRRLELQLLTDATNNHWRLCLALVHGIGDMANGRDGVFGLKKSGQPFEPSWAQKLIHDEFRLLPQGIQYATLFLHRLQRNCFMLYVVENDDFSRGEVLGIDNGWLPIPSDPSLDALLLEVEDNEIGGHLIDAPLERFWNRPAPAKSRTLAGMILRNLAYAPDHERYDLLLLEDAKRKAKMAAEFSEQRSEEYRTAISRVLNPSTQAPQS